MKFIVCRKFAWRNARPLNREVKAIKFNAGPGVCKRAEVCTYILLCQDFYPTNFEQARRKEVKKEEKEKKETKSLLYLFVRSEKSTQALINITIIFIISKS